MKMIRSLVFAASVAGVASTTSAETIYSVSEAAEACKVHAASQYASADQPARVQFKGVYGGTDRRKVRMQVLPAQGRAFLAICEVSRRSGEIVGLTPGATDRRPMLAAVILP